MDPSKRDDVGTTSNPATGPYPEGNVEVLPPDDLNRGETGDEDLEEDYEDESDALGG